MDGIAAETRTGAGVSLGLPLEDASPIVEEVISLIAIAGLEDGEARLALVEDAVDIFDYAILPEVSGSLDEVVLYMIKYTGVDMLELISCLTVEGVSETIAWAVNTLRGRPEQRPSSLEAYASCLGIDPVVVDADDRATASAVIYAAVTAINQMLSKLASEAGAP